MPIGVETPSSEVLTEPNEQVLPVENGGGKTAAIVAAIAIAAAVGIAAAVTVALLRRKRRRHNE